MLASSKSSLNLSEREVFLSFCKHGSLTKAAESLSIYPSTVSRCINNLEKNLCVDLVKKSGNKLVLTECGEQYYNILDSFLSKIIAHETNISQSTPLEITIITSDFFLEAWVSKHISDFIEEHNNIKIRIISNGSLTKDTIKDNTIFVGAGRNNTDAQNMVIKNIARTHVGFYARNKNSFVKKDEIYTINELTKMPIIKIDSRKNDYLTSCDRKISYTFSNIVMVVDSLPLAAQQGVLFDCIFIGCGTSTLALIERDEVFKIKTQEELDPIYIDVLFTETLKRNAAALDLINRLQAGGIALFSPSGD